MTDTPEDKLASVVIPVAGPEEPLGDCLAAVARQDYAKVEVIVAAGASADRGAMPQGSEDLRVIRREKPCSDAQLVNDGMRAARGHVKVLLRPSCVPEGTDWLANMVRPFDEESVGVVVSGCRRARPANLAARLLESILPRCRDTSARSVETVSHLADAYRASLLADVGYFSDEMPAPGDAVDMSIKVENAGYEIRISGMAAVVCHAATGERSLGDALREGFDYGRADALLDREYDLQWLNAGIYGAVLFCLILPLLGAFSLPLAWLAAFAIFVWGWILSVRLPLLRWEAPVAPLNFGAYVLVVLLARGDWWIGIFGERVHPAVVRQWLWLAAVLGSYLAVLAWASVVGAVRACGRTGDFVHAVPMVFVGAGWRLVAGAGYVAASLFGRGSED
jgi:GT2 family glycosyltransferase